MSQPTQRVVIHELGCGGFIGVFLAVISANLLALVAFIVFAPTLKVETPERAAAKEEAHATAQEAAKKPAFVVVTRDTKSLNGPFSIHVGTEFPYKGRDGERYVVTIKGEPDSIPVQDAELRTASGERVTD